MFNFHKVKRPSSVHSVKLTIMLLMSFLFSALLAPLSKATLLTHDELQAQLITDPSLILGDWVAPYQVPQMLSLSPLPVTDMELFRTQLLAIDPDLHTPITYYSEAAIGDTHVQMRAISRQIEYLTGRTLLNSVAHPNADYANEVVQINTLYQNALDFYFDPSNGSQSFGSTLDMYEVNALVKPMVWPRRLCGLNIPGAGTCIYMPVVYLPQSIIDQYNVVSNVIEANGTSTFESLLLNDVTISFGREAFVNVINDLVNNGGTIRGEADLRITTGGQFQNLSGVIEADGDLAIGANSVLNQTLVYHYNTAVGTSSAYGEIARLDAQSGDLIIKSYNDIIFSGSSASAPEGELALSADGNLFLGAEPIYTSDSSGFGSGVKNTQALEFLTSALTAKDTITLLAGGQMVIDAAEIISDQGHIELLSALGITIEDELSITQSQASGSFGKRDVTESVYQTVAIRSLLDAGRGVRLHTDFGDITLKATDITSTEGTTVSAANGGINLLTTVETDQYNYSSVKSGLFTTRTQNRGHDITTGVPNSIVGGMVVEAVSSLNVEYVGDASLSLDEQIAEISQLPGMAWMATVRDQQLTPDINWTAIETQYNSWNESSTTLSPAFAAVVAIAVAIVTQDYTGALASQVLGLGSAAAGAGSATFVAVQAGFASLFSQTVLTLGNGVVNGNVGEAMEQLVSVDTIRNVAVSMLTAGAIANLDARFFEYFNPELPADEILNARDHLTLAQQALQQTTEAVAQAGVNNLAFGTDFEDGFRASLLGFAADNIGEQMAQSIGNTFKLSDQNSFDKVFQYIQHAAAGCVVGVIRGNSTDGSDDRENYCASGAGGALVGEFVGDIYAANVDYNEKVELLNELGDSINNFQETAEIIAQDMTTEEKFAFALFLDSGDYSQLTNFPDDKFSAVTDYAYDLYNFRVTQASLYEMQQTGVDLAKLTAASAAFLAGGDVNISALAAENAVDNNALWFIPPAIKTFVSVLTAWGVYEVTVGFKEKYDRYKDRLTSDDPEVSGQAAEEMAWELAEEAGIAAGGSLVITGALYAGKELFEVATKWDKLGRVIKLLEKAGHHSAAELDELRALFFSRGGYRPGDGVDNFDRIYYPSDAMKADGDHLDWIRYASYQKVNVIDPKADALAERLNGVSSVKIPGKFKEREFDVLSENYIGQTKPSNFQLGSQFRKQAQATFEAAIDLNKTPYFHFDGPPSDDVLRKLSEYANRFGIEPVIDTNPL